MANRKKSEPDIHERVGRLEAENRLLKADRRSSATASVLNTLIQWSGLCVICWFAYLSIDSLAGKTTWASIDLKLAAQVVWGAVGAGGILYGARQKHLRQSTTERLQGRIRELETAIDPNRSTSGLTPRGETNPRDRI